MILKILNVSKNLIATIDRYQNLCIQQTLDLLLDMSLTFEVETAITDLSKLKCENYIRIDELKRQFVIKEIESGTDGITRVTAILDLEVLQRWELYELNTGSVTISQFVNNNYKEGREAYTVNISNLTSSNQTKKRTISTDTNADGLEFFKMALRTFRMECDVDAYSKKFIFYETMGSPRGAHFIAGLNLKNMRMKSSSYDYCSELEYQGMDGSTSTKFGMVTNYGYSAKQIRKRWIDERYTDSTTMKSDCTARLKDMSKPYTSYEVDVIDLASLSTEYASMSYAIGDTIRLFNSITGTTEQQRIMGIEMYPDTPENNKVTLANKILTFDEKSELYRLN